MQNNQNNDKKSFYELLDRQSEAFEKELEAARARGETVPESVWADGVPQKINPDDLIKQDELLSMAVNYLMKNEIVRYGFKIEPGFPRPSYPNIVCKRNGKVYAIIVVPNVFPHFQVINEESRLQVVKQCKERNIIPLFAPVGYRALDRQRAAEGIMLRGDIFVTIFRGFIILNETPDQLKSIKPSDLLVLDEKEENKTLENA
ncbi:MAG: hypothetical protein K6E20_02975 [Acholeplasmatales bacterium]|nr:hypothetical protein [Acholeplasmatales bacterium]